ncbi:MAG: hypothetical protein ACLRWP_07115 [Bilophila wadsworthia]
MSTMLELYRHRFGAGVKARGNGWNGPCPICGGEVGKSDRFMIWPDRERDLGHTCTENHIPGVFSCRRCGRTGDSIRYMVDMEGMSFREACAELGISDMPVRPLRRPAPLEPQVRAAWQPSVRKGLRRSGKTTRRSCWPKPRPKSGIIEALKWLAKRGITEEVIRTYHLAIWLARTASPDGSGRVPSSASAEAEKRQGPDMACLSLAAS